MKILNTTVALAAALTLGACADHDHGTRADQPAGSTAVTERTYYNENDNNRLLSTTISFDTGSYAFSDTTRRQLQDLVQAARERGNLADIKVAVWSDHAFPAGQAAANQATMDLPKADRDLAAQRGKVIENYLENTLKTSSVEVFSMTERANWLARMFNSDDAELKSSFAKREYPISEGKFALLRKGAPSKAIVVIETR